MLSFGKLCNELGSSHSWPIGETPRVSKGKKGIQCNIENFVPVVAVTKQKTVPSMEFSAAKGNLEREQEVEDTMLDLLKPFTERLKEYDVYSSTLAAGCDPTHELVEEQSHDVKLPSVAADAERYSGQNTTSKKGIIGSQRSGNHQVFSHYPKAPTCKLCEKTNT